MARRSPNHPGIQVRHQRGCASARGQRCSCRPTYLAEVWSSKESTKIRRSFAVLAEARAWRADAQVQLRKGLLRASAPVTLREAADAWLAGARSGAIRNRSGDAYKPSTLRGYEEALRLRVLDDLGGARLDAIHRAALQKLVDSLLSDGRSPSTIRNTLLPLRAIFRRAVARGEVSVNPTRGLELPAVRGRRERIASPKEAAALLATLSLDRVIWATAMYAGLRRGELRALDLDDIDLANNVIRVRRSWDSKEGLIEPKSRAGHRVIPIPGALRTILAEHRLSVGRSSGLAFGRTEAVPFQPRTVTNRANGAWKKADLKPITLHECRPTFASLMIAAGVNAKALSTYMGHSSVVITFDLYGHLMPGNEAEAADLLDAYLGRAHESYRSAPPTSRPGMPR
jgi:integrase